MAYGYAYQGSGEVARGVALDQSVSVKSAVMVAAFVRGKPVARVERELDAVIAMRAAVPFTRFSEGAGHKRGIGPGKYPVKTATVFRQLLASVKANAEDLGMGDDLIVIGATANKGAEQPRYGRHRGRVGKATHVELVLAEREPGKKAAKAPAKTEKPTKAPAKKAAKPAPKKPAEKAPVKEAAKPAPKSPAKKAEKKEPAPAKKESKEADA